jgi:biotin carboxyl carrier protein
LEGAESRSGGASIAAVGRGAYSVLLNSKSFTVYVSENEGLLEVWAAGQRHWLSVADARDRAVDGKKEAATGRVEIRAQMPGKIIKLLASAGATVAAGQGVIVVEAMKMQNEMKSPKSGVVSHVRVKEGSTVAAGETMMVVE